MKERTPPIVAWRGSTRKSLGSTNTTLVTARLFHSLAPPPPPPQPTHIHTPKQTQKNGEAAILKTSGLPKSWRSAYFKISHFMMFVLNKNDEKNNTYSIRSKKEWNQKIPIDWKWSWCSYGVKRIQMSQVNIIWNKSFVFFLAKKTISVKRHMKPQDT